MLPKAMLAVTVTTTAMYFMDHSLRLACGPVGDRAQYVAFV